MFYEPLRGDHGLPHDPFKSCVVPRPIGWISTVDVDGRRNLAPYSFFSAVSWVPPMVAFASTGRSTRDGSCKDTLANVEATGEFVVNMATAELAGAVNLSSSDLVPGADEFKLAGVEAIPSRLVRAPRVAVSPIALECRLFQIVPLPSGSTHRPNALAIGEVVGVHIADHLLVDGRIDIGRLRPVARLGYHDWAVIDEAFALAPPPLTGARRRTPA